MMLRMTSLARFLPPLCLGLCCSIQAAEPNSMPSAKASLEAPAVHEQNGVLYATQGFILRLPQDPHSEQPWNRTNELTLTGDMLRWNKKSGLFFASGNINLITAGMHLTAERLGYNTTTGDGDIWSISLVIHKRKEAKPQEASTEARTWEVSLSAQKEVDTLSEVTAAHGSKRGNLVSLFDTNQIAGHGALSSITANEITVELAETPNLIRTGFLRNLNSVTTRLPRVRLAGIPVISFPYYHNDLTVDHPWTRLRFGKKSRIGYFSHIWFGDDLPPLGDLKLRPIARIGLHDQAGFGYGYGLRMRSTRFGNGYFKHYQMDEEQVRDIQGNSPTEIRYAEHSDTDYGFRFSGGAARLRWTNIADADQSVSSGIPNQRFRHDYLPDDMESMTLARRGVSATWGTEWGSIYADTDRAPHLALPETTRHLRLAATMPTLHLWGPLHISASALSDQLALAATTPGTETSATRSHYTAKLGMTQWLGGTAWDASLAIQSLSYDNATLAGTEESASSRYTTRFDSGFRVRLHGSGNGISHTCVPKIGVQIHNKGTGHDLPAFNFQDNLDTLAEDEHYWTISLNNTLRINEYTFTCDLLSRWAMRAKERTYTDSSGIEQVSDDALIDVSANIAGQISTALSLSSNALYNAQQQEFSRFDLTSELFLFDDRLSFRYGTNMTVSNNDPTWTKTAGFTVVGNRYSTSVDGTFLEGGQDIDHVQIELIRHLVDGSLSCIYEREFDETGTLYDEGFFFKIALTSFGAF